MLSGILARALARVKRHPGRDLHKPRWRDYGRSPRGRPAIGRRPTLASELDIRPQIAIIQLWRLVAAKGGPVIPTIGELARFYGQQLFEDVIPFWLQHSLDEQYGGYLTCLDAQGRTYCTDKAMWLQARQVWMFAKLHNTIDSRPEWLEAARLGYQFLTRHGFDDDGRMFFTTTRDGRPLRKRRYLFTETFGVIACAEYARASGSAQAHDLARRTFRLVWQLYTTPCALESKTIMATRRTRALAMPMILLATTQELRQTDNDPLYDSVTRYAVAEIVTQFLKRDEKALHEVVGENGERLDSPQGRCINPGHAIETAWFLMHEGLVLGAQSIIDDALQILDWSLDWGWDKEHGGILSFVDIEGRPPEQLEWDMKLWWPHTEALYATLLAHHLTGLPRYLDWHERIRRYAFERFADPEHGEWRGYLHRDGTVALSVKGSLWKGAFHVPRALWLCHTLASRVTGAQAS